MPKNANSVMEFSRKYWRLKAGETKGDLDFDDDDSSEDSSDNEPPAPRNRAIYPLKSQKGWRVTVTPYDSAWPTQFETIKAQLHRLLRSSNPPATYTTIEHIGSTSIPGLYAKPNIDILITVPNQAELDKALEAFAWEIPTEPPYVKYTRMPNGGGIQGRESFKLHIPSWTSYPSTTTATENTSQTTPTVSPNNNPTIPSRSVYLINTDHTQNPAGQVQIRCYRDVKKTLSNPGNQDLFQEYAKLKQELSKKVFGSSTEYAQSKDGMIRKILLRAGWSAEEVDEKERLSRIVVADDADEHPY